MGLVTVRAAAIYISPGLPLMSTGAASFTMRRLCSSQKPIFHGLRGFHVTLVRLPSYWLPKTYADRLKAFIATAKIILRDAHGQTASIELFIATACSGKRLCAYGSALLDLADAHGDAIARSHVFYRPLPPSSSSLDDACTGARVMKRKARK